MEQVEPDLYKRLGIAEDAEFSSIRKAYHTSTRKVSQIGLDANYVF